MAYNRLEKFPEAEAIRQVSKDKVNDRLLERGTNQSLREIMSYSQNIPTRGMKGSGLKTGLIQSRMVGSGGGLPDEEAFEEARAIGKGKLLGRTDMREQAEGLGRYYGGALLKGDKELEGMLKSGDMEAFKKGFLEALEKKEGKGKLTITHGDEEMSESDKEDKMKGCGGGLPAHSTYSGSGRRTRRPASASDKRRQRGAMVSKLMKENGMSLAEASKYIKHNGLI
jgi:hypothetical protein